MRSDWITQALVAIEAEEQTLAARIHDLADARKAILTLSHPLMHLDAQPLLSESRPAEREPVTFTREMLEPDDEDESLEAGEPQALIDAARDADQARGGPRHVEELGSEGRRERRERLQQMIRAFLLRNPRQTNQQLAQQFGMNAGYRKALLEELERQGLVGHVGSHRHTLWFALDEKHQIIQTATDAPPPLRVVPEHDQRTKDVGASPKEIAAWSALEAAGEKKAGNLGHQLGPWKTKGVERQARCKSCDTYVTIRGGIVEGPGLRSECLARTAGA